MMSLSLRAAIGILRAFVPTMILAAGLFGSAQGVVATPASLADGSEIVVTDGDGDRLLGYGRVEGSVLRLSVAAHDDDGLAVMVIDPDGRLSTLAGRFAADGLRVRGPGAGEEVTLLSWLSERGVTLTLVPVGPSSDDDDDDRDDDRDEGDREDDGNGSPTDGPSGDGDGERDDDSDDEADDGGEHGEDDAAGTGDGDDDDDDETDDDDDETDDDADDAED